MCVFSFSRWVTYQLVVSVCYLTTLYLSSRGKSQSDVILTLTPERWIHRTYLPIQLWALERVFIYLHMFTLSILGIDLVHGRDMLPLDYISYLLLWLFFWHKGSKQGFGCPWTHSLALDDLPVSAAQWAGITGLYLQACVLFLFGDKHMDLFLFQEKKWTVLFLPEDSHWFSALHLKLHLPGMPHGGLRIDN